MCVVVEGANHKRKADNYQAQFKDDVEYPNTPTKKRKLLAASTPTSRSSARAIQKFTTPTHQR